MRGWGCPCVALLKLLANDILSELRAQIPEVVTKLVALPQVSLCVRLSVRLGVVVALVDIVKTATNLI